VPPESAPSLLAQLLSRVYPLYCSHGLEADHNKNRGSLGREFRPAEEY
jgi:hypothetical protein